MSTETPNSPGLSGLLIMAVLILVGAGSMLLLDASPQAWPLAAAAGWAVTGLLGMGAWMSVRKAFRADPQAFFKVVFGGMFLRMVFLGVAVGLVLGFEWLDTYGFVGGMGAGMLVFQSLEIILLSAAAKKSSQGGTMAAEVEHAR